MSAPGPEQRKNVARISTRVPSHLHARIEQAAAWRGMSVSSFVVEAAAKEAALVIERERQIQLSTEDARLVVSLLEDPPSPNEALRKAVEHHKRLIRG